MRHLVLAASLIALGTLPTVAVAQQTESERRAAELSAEAERRRADDAWYPGQQSEADLAGQRQRSAEAYQWQEANRKEIEAIRARVMKGPPLPVAKNPLLGRWVMITKTPAITENLTDLMVNMQANMETLACAVMFGEEEFEYRPDVLVLDDAGGDMVADKVAYRAGNGGSVFALGDKLIRLLLFEFDVGADRMRQGKCVYARVKARGAKAPAAAAPAAVTAPAAPTAGPRTYPGAGFKVAGATLGVDGMQAVYRDVTARGGSLAGGGREGLGAMRFYGRDAGYRHAGADVFAVAYDFDSGDPAVARLVAVTLAYPFDKSVVAARAAALAAWNPKPAGPGRLEGRKGDVWLVLEERPADGFVGETYLLK